MDGICTWEKYTWYVFSVRMSLHNDVDTVSMESMQVYVCICNMY